jgi:hypothetical protein
MVLGDVYVLAGDMTAQEGRPLKKWGPQLSVQHGKSRTMARQTELVRN